MLWPQMRARVLCACLSNHASNCLRIIVFIYRFCETADGLNAIQINSKLCYNLQNPIHVRLFQDAIFTLSNLKEDSD